MKKQELDSMAALIVFCVEHGRECEDPTCVTAITGAQIEAWFARCAAEMAAFAERWQATVRQYHERSSAVRALDGGAGRRLRDEDAGDLCRCNECRYDHSEG